MRYEGKEAVEKALREKKELYEKVMGYEIHPTGLPTGQISLSIDVTSLLNMMEDAKRGHDMPDIDEKDLVEISLNLTQAAKIVEKTNPKLADWLKFVNRKAIALVNKEK